MIGFGLHNATEGFGIVAPLSGDAEQPSWRFLALLGVIGGCPTFFGTLVGQAWTSTAVSILFLALAAGSILYVVMELLNVCRLFVEQDDHRLGPAARADARVRDGLRARRGRRLGSTLVGVALRHRRPARHRARARRARFTYELPDGAGKGAVVSVPFGRGRTRGVVVGRRRGAARRASTRGRSRRSCTSCRRRWSTSRSGSPSTTARRRRGRSSWSRRCGRRGARSRRRRASGSRSRARRRPSG